MGIMNVAKAIATTVFGEQAGERLLRAFSTSELKDIQRASGRSKMFSEIENVIGASSIRDTEEAANLLKGFKEDKNYMDMFDKISNLTAGENREEAFNKAIESFNKSRDLYEMEKYSELLGRDAGTGIGIGGVARGYFADPVYGTTRTVGTIGAVAGTGIGIRYLRGGTLTQKPNGENDIAGIPFV